MSADLNAILSPLDDRSKSENVLGIPVIIDVLVGSANMTISKLVELEEGAVIILDRKLMDPVDVSVNGRIIAKGVIVALDDDPNQLAVSLLEII